MAPCSNFSILGIPGQERFIERYNKIYILIDVDNLFIKLIKYQTNKQTYFYFEERNMENYSQTELDAALQLIFSTISKCEKMQLKFAEGTSQYSLLKNRIKALYISKD
ncbi:MAG: hypothetical protein K0S61_1172, partial [Anaerocolumna sp.]|nr:hypothetical protein [Anaerocolumna sp.]